MPYDVVNPGTVEQAWNKSTFDDTREKEAAENMAKQQVATAQQLGLLNNLPQGNAPVASPATATQVLAQGGANVARSLTPQEYEVGVLNYLMNKKGYSYEDAAKLMAPEIALYQKQDAANKKQQAETLAAQLNNVPVDSDLYRAGAYRLAQLDPDIGKLYLTDAVSKKEKWLRNNAIADRNLARQQKREDAIWTAGQQMQNKIALMQLQDQYKQKQAENTYNFLVSKGYDPQQAIALAMGIRNGGRTGAGSNSGLLSGITNQQLKVIQDEYNKMLEKVEDGTLPESERGRFMHYGRFLKQNADSLAGYAPQQAPNLQAFFDQQVGKFGYSDDLVKNFREYVGKKGYNLSDNDIATLTEKYRSKK